MQRPSIWLMLVIVLASLLFLREPRIQAWDEDYLRWLLRNSHPAAGIIPLTVVEIGRDPTVQKMNARTASEASVSPVEFSLFLQAALEFKPTVIAFESVLHWRAGTNVDQQQIFLDQAMRVPKLLVAAELTSNPDLDTPPLEVPGFTNVTGRRGDLPTYSGLNRQPAEDIRLISTLGFIGGDLPEDTIHVPLLFNYRGDVVPSFALQAAMLWMRVTPAEVKIDIGQSISFPNGKRIPIRADGTALVNPNAARRARQMSLNDLLLAAQQHEKRLPTQLNPDSIRDDIVLERTVNEPQPPPGIIAATIATIQTGSFPRRVNWAFDCGFIVALVVLSGFVRRFSRIDIVLIAIAVTAAYILAGLATVSAWFIWLPGVLPLSAVGVVAIFCLFAPRSKSDPDLPPIAPSPPSP